MRRNYALHLSPGIWIAPLFAPIGGAVFFLHIPNARVELVLPYIGFAILIAYMFTLLIVIPILKLSRHWVRWNALRVLILGVLAPLAVYLLSILNAARVGQYSALAEGHFRFVLMNEMPTLISISGAGAVVSVAFLAIQQHSTTIAD